jgi:hypothetical protein
MPFLLQNWAMKDLAWLTCRKDGGNERMYWRIREMSDSMAAGVASASGGEVGVRIYW